MNRLETLAFKLLQAALSFEDAYKQGHIVSEDALDLHNRAEEIILRLGTSMTCGPVMETRGEVTAHKVAA